MAIVGNEPRVLTLKEALAHFVDHRREVTVRKTNFRLRKARERAHLLEGLKIALDNLDAVIELIRAAASPAEASAGLQARFGLSELQAKHILELRLQRLTGMEREKILEEYRETLKLIERLQQILGSEALVAHIIKEELLEVKKQFANERRTEIVAKVDEIRIEDMIREEEMGSDKIGP